MRVGDNIFFAVKLENETRSAPGIGLDNNQAVPDLIESNCMRTSCNAA
jgi:hypothetical protein